MKILGIETSCDETATAVVRDGREVLSNVIHSQVALHAPYGGVVPEVASRSHLRELPALLDLALERAGLAGWRDVDAVAATYGPGLAGSLLVGLAAGKALAWRLDIPFFAVDHIEAHLYSPFLAPGAPSMEEASPFIALVVSGGHTALFRVEAPGRYRLLGQTVDDAAGEAFDKAAALLDLGYPGGPAIDRLARDGRPDAIRFPRSRPRAGRHWTHRLDPSLCFSFSGLKTALLYHLRLNGPPKTDAERADLAASFQEAVVDVLVDRCDRALRGETILAVGGGVSLNSRLRRKLADLADRRGVRLLTAPPAYCADNAAMIAGLAGIGCALTGEEAMRTDIQPSLRIRETS